MLLLSPHLDDAALSCCRRLQHGDVTNVATVFAGEPARGGHLSDWDRLTHATDSGVRLAERKVEDATAWASVDQPFVQLNYIESESDSLAVSDLRNSMRHHARGCDTVLIPAGIGNHPHHILVRDEAIAALSAHKKIILYGELPYAAFYGWPELGLANLDVPAYWASCMAPVEAAFGNLVPRLAWLTPSELQWKLSLLSHYPSQMTAVGGGSLDLIRQTNLFHAELEFDLPDH
jgi:hypothetical protein